MRHESDAMELAVCHRNRCVTLADSNRFAIPAPFASDYIVITSKDLPWHDSGNTKPCNGT
jgi:hypothetical protein